MGMTSKNPRQKSDNQGFWHKMAEKQIDPIYQSGHNDLFLFFHSAECDFSYLVRLKNSYP